MRIAKVFHVSEHLHYSIFLCDHIYFWQVASLRPPIVVKLKRFPSRAIGLRFNLSAVGPILKLNMVLSSHPIQPMLFTDDSTTV